MDLTIKLCKDRFENSRYFHINIYFVNAGNARLVCVSR